MDMKIDQGKLESQIRQLLFTAKKEERIAAEQPDTAQRRLARADELRRQAEDKGRDLPGDVMERLMKEYSSGNVVR